VLEGTTTNVFAVFGDSIVTPEEGILPGITRGVVLDLLDGVYHIEQRALPLEELLRADEVFITASNKQVMPIVRVDDHVIGGGAVGPHTLDVMTRYRAFAYGLEWANNG
jgi:branched-chain amino acid aminotransferase